MNPSLDEIRSSFFEEVVLGPNEVALPIWNADDYYGIGTDQSGAAILVMRPCSESVNINERNFSFKASSSLSIRGRGTIGDVSVLVVNRDAQTSIDIDAIATVFLGLIEVAGESSVALSDVIESLSELFDKGRFRAISLQEQIGIAGELLMLHRSRDLDMAVMCWRSGDRDLFDFSRHSERVEVKTTTGMDRIHNFNESQVPGPTDCKVIIASVLLRRVERGTTVEDLAKEIWNKLDNSHLKAEFLKKIGVVLGSSMSSDEYFHFDLQGSSRSIKFFPSTQVPRPIQVPGVLKMSWTALLEGDFTIDYRSELIDSLCGQ